MLKVLKVQHAIENFKFNEDKLNTCLGHACGGTKTDLMTQSHLDHANSVLDVIGWKHDKTSILP